MTVAEIQARFFELKGKLAVGQLTEAEFKTELEKLRFQDSHGRWWMIGVQSGRWYYHENGRWLVGTPPESDQSAAAPVEQEAKPTAPVATIPLAPTPTPTPQPTAEVPVQKAEEPKPTVASAPAPVTTKPVVPPPPPVAKKETPAPTLPSPVAVERMRQASETPSVALGPKRKRLDSRLVIVGAALLGLIVVIILLFVADQVIANKPITSFIARTVGGQTTATPPRTTPTLTSNASVPNLIGLGDKLWNDGQIDPAIAQYQAAVKLEPNNADAQIRLAQAYALVGRLSEANAAANKAVALEPNNPAAHAQLARALAWSGQNDAAIIAAQKSIALDANNPAAHAFLSEAFLRAGRVTEAQTEADAAIKLNANSADAHRAKAWALIVSGKPDDGVKEWNRVVELATNFFFYHFEFGEVFRVYLNDPAKSISEYQRASQLYSSYVPAYISLGQAYLALNQPGNAILQFQRAITFDPNSSEAYGYLGAGFKMQDKCTQAIPYYQKALELNPKLNVALSGLNDCGVTDLAIPAATPQGTPKPGAVPTSLAPATVVPLPSGSPQPNATKSTTQPAAPVPGKIAYAIYDGQYHLYLFTSAGGKKLLTELANAPMLSPEGTQVLFQSWVSDQRGIHRIDVNGSADEPVSIRFEDTNPSWAPDGTRYVYATRAGPGADVAARPFTLRIGDPTSKARQDPAIFVDKAQSPVWSLQNRIVYRDCGFPTDACGLTAIDPDGGNKKQLTTVNSASPSWSPDGTKVVFMSDADRGNWDIWMVSATGGSPQRLTDDAAEDGLPAWSPDGKLIAFVSKRGGIWGMWVMNADGTNQRKLFDLGGDPFGTVKGNPSGQPGQLWIEQRISWSK